MGFRAYRATRQHDYTATRKGKQRGTRNGAPQHSWSLLLFSTERFLNLFIVLVRPDIGTTVCGLDMGNLVIVVCRTACLSCCWTTGLHGYQATLLPSYLAIGLQHSPAGRWLLIDILTALNRAGIIHRVIDGRACLLANLIERFRMGVFRRGFLSPCAGDDLADGFDTAD